MKKKNFWAKLVLAVCVMCVFNACEEEPKDPTPNPTPDEGSPTIGECYTITFDALPEGVALNANGVWDGSGGEGGFSIDSIWFNNAYNTGGWSDGGFNISNNVDMQTAGWTNQYSVYSKSGANGSQNFAVVHYSAYASADGSNSGFEFEKTPSHVKSVKVNNSTYTYLTLKNGDGFAQPMSDGDWFKVIFTGALNGKPTSSVEFFLADFRDGKTFICSEWTEVNLTTLGVVDQVKITFDGSDQGDYGLNTPTYVCIDDVEIEK